MPSCHCTSGSLTFRGAKGRLPLPVTSRLHHMICTHARALDFKHGLRGWGWPELKVLLCCVMLVQLERSLQKMSAVEDHSCKSSVSAAVSGCASFRTSCLSPASGRPSTAGRPSWQLPSISESSPSPPPPAPTLYFISQGSCRGASHCQVVHSPHSARVHAASWFRRAKAYLLSH